MSIKVSMPSNIALIKYMGKTGKGQNRPANSSLSFTLGHLTSSVQLTQSEQDEWSPMVSDFPINMSEAGKERFLAHFAFLRKELNGQGFFKIQSANNFPADCGIASSASSFAALTQAACEQFAPELSTEKCAYLSSLGSGSSCRSFMPGWVMWSGDMVRAVPSPYQELLHMVVIVGDQKKKVSSSDAHKRVQMSLLYNDRVLRAEVRLRAFIEAMSEKDWTMMYEIAWAEFWDMHALFETCQPSFSYFQPETITVLNEIRDYWQSKKDGPLVTMDAGPNIHMLWRPEQLKKAQAYFTANLKDRFTCLSNIEGIGFARV